MHLVNKNADMLTQPGGSGAFTPKLWLAGEAAHYAGPLYPTCRLTSMPLFGILADAGHMTTAPVIQQMEPSWLHHKRYA